MPSHTERLKLVGLVYILTCRLRQGLRSIISLPTHHLTTEFKKTAKRDASNPSRAAVSCIQAANKRRRRKQLKSSSSSQSSASLSQTSSKSKLHPIEAPPPTDSTQTQRRIYKASICQDAVAQTPTNTSKPSRATHHPPKCLADQDPKAECVVPICIRSFHSRPLHAPPTIYHPHPNPRCPILKTHLPSSHIFTPHSATPLPQHPA